MILKSSFHTLHISLSLAKPWLASLQPSMNFSCNPGFESFVGVFWGVFVHILCNEMHVYVFAQPGTIPMTALGCHKIPPSCSGTDSVWCNIILDVILLPQNNIDLLWKMNWNFLDFFFSCPTYGSVPSSVLQRMMNKSEVCEHDHRPESWEMLLLNNWLMMS